MYTKILVLSLTIAFAVGSDHHHLHSNEYRIPHQIPVQEPTSEEYKPESHAYSSQSIVHQGHAVAYEESHGTNDHEHPAYQYQVDDQAVDSPHHQLQHKYQPLYHHEVQTVRVPTHHKVVYYPDPHELHKAPMFHPEIQQHKVHYHSEPHLHETHGKVYIHSEPHLHEAAHIHSEPHLHETHGDVQIHAEPNLHESHGNLHIHAEAHGALHHSHAPVHSEPHTHDEPIDYYAYPKYQYEYKVEDPHTGDNKFQHEIRDGDVVKGIYGLQDADGSFRTVEYSSDKHHGFSAIVKHTAPGQHVHIETHHQDEEHKH